MTASQLSAHAPITVDRSIAGETAFNTRRHREALSCRSKNMSSALVVFHVSFGIETTPRGIPGQLERLQSACFGMTAAMRRGTA